jgi:hypothetical protein
VLASRVDNADTSLVFGPRLAIEKFKVLQNCRAQSRCFANADSAVVTYMLAVHEAFDLNANGHQTGAAPNRWKKVWKAGNGLARSTSARFINGSKLLRRLLVD